MFSLCILLLHKRTKIEQVSKNTGTRTYFPVKNFIKKNDKLYVQILFYSLYFDVSSFFSQYYSQ